MRVCGALFLMVLIGFGAGAARASEIDRFFGVWRTPEAELSILPRGSDVRVQWRAAGDGEPGRLSEVLQSGDGGTRFSQKDPGNPLEGQALVWADLAGGTMTIYRLVIASSGAFSLASFVLTPGPDGLGVALTEIVEGRERRSRDLMLERAGVGQ